jgi:SAM-dependent methyltransferase
MVIAMGKFVDPLTKHALREDDDGNLYYQNGQTRFVYVNHGGVYDFSVVPGRYQAEKRHYDRHYKDVGRVLLTPERIREAWYDETRPENLLLLRHLGDLRDKRILLLGNGTSYKELYFLHLGAEVVYTDISIEAAKQMKRLYESSGLGVTFGGKIEFHAVDAVYLPFPDGSFDVVYGYGFAHHLKELDPLIAEVSRCLKAGGMCRFLDDAYAPLWESVKNTILKPLQILVHKKRGISPEDLRSTRRGGYREREIADLFDRFGYTDVVFARTSFFLFLFRRGLGKLFGWDPEVFRRWSLALKLVKWIDGLAGKNRLIESNLIALVWGFTK